MAKIRTPEKPENKGFLSGIDAKLAALQELRDSYLKALSVGAIGGDLDAVGLGGIGASVASRTADAPVDLPTGAFLNKSIPDAIKLLFVATKRKYTPAEATVALKDGGYESTSQNFEKTVSGTMYRMKDQGVLLKFKDGFGLAELYPDHLRAKLSETSKPAAKARKRAKPPNRIKAAAKARARAPIAKRASRQKSTEPGIDDQILKILLTEGPNSCAAFAARLGRPANVVGLALGRLAKYGRAEKLPSGNYGAGKNATALRAV